MMGHKQKLFRDEVDMVLWRDYAYLERSGVKKKIKRRLWKRARMEKREELLRFIEEEDMVRARTS